MAMAKDGDARVRLEVVRRLPVTQLKWLQGDADWRVRYELAGRIDTEALAALISDVDPLVRERCRERLQIGGGTPHRSPPASTSSFIESDR
jgi:hypothetical protein